MMTSYLPRQTVTASRLARCAPHRRAGTFLGPALICAALGLGLVGCGSTAASSGKTSHAGTTYPIVVGMAYATDSAKGTVAADGSYTYKDGENVSFSVGGLNVGASPTGPMVTPLALGDDVASLNLLRMLKALDSDGDLSNGVTLQPMTDAAAGGIDLRSEAAVQAALTGLAPSAVLPAADDPQVVQALADAKATDLKNLGNYGTTYTAILIDPATGCGAAQQVPKDAVLQLNGQPNWTAETLTGVLTLTLVDGSTVSLPVDSANGSYTASGAPIRYSVQAAAKTARVVRLLFWAGDGCIPRGIVVRDNAAANKPPVPGLKNGVYEVAIHQGAPNIYSFKSLPSGANAFVALGSHDFDGIVVSQSWSSSKGDFGVGEVFTLGAGPSESFTVTLTATDDEGASASKTYQVNAGAGPAATTSTLVFAGSLSGSFVAGRILAADGEFPPASGANPFQMFDVDHSSDPKHLTDYPFAVVTRHHRVWMVDGVDGVGGHVYQLRLNAFEDSSHNILLRFDGQWYDSLEWDDIGTSEYLHGECLVGGNCSSAGIEFDRTAGTVKFTQTPFWRNFTPPPGGFTMTGSLTFTPF